MVILLKVVAAFWAAEKTEEKKPVCWDGFGLGLGCSGVGVNGADCMFESLLGPRLADPDLALRWDIIFPEGEVTTFEFELTGSDDPRSRLDGGNRGALKSVGVGGVLTIVGATSPAGGVDGADCSSTVVILAVRGRSGVATTAGDGAIGTVFDRSGNRFPKREDTLPRRLLPSKAKDVVEPPNCRPLTFRSGLVSGLADFFGLSASRNLPTGEGERLCDPSSGARSVLATREGVESDVASLLIESRREVD